MTKDDIKLLIESGLPGARARVLGDDGQHFEAEVTYEGFAGRSVIQQHRMVYGTLGERMGREIHALQLKTRTA